MVYVYTGTLDLEESLTERMIRTMPPERCARAGRYRRAKDRCLCILSYQILRFAVRQEYGLEQLPEIRLTPRGKPYFANTYCEFNLSHCERGIAVAVSGEKIGVDLQEPVSFLEDVKTQFLSPVEMQYITEHPHTTLDLLKLWTLKEAYGKCQGDGLLYPFRETDFLEFLSTDAVCTYDHLYARSLEYKECVLSIFAARREETEIRDVDLTALL